MVSHGHEHCPHCGVELQGDEPLCPSCSGALFGVARQQSKTEIAKETAKEIASRTSDAISSVSQKASALGRTAMSTVGAGMEKASSKIGDISMPTINSTNQTDEGTGMIPIMDAQDTTHSNPDETITPRITETMDETSRLISEGEALAAAGKPGEASEKFRNAIATDPTNADCWFNLGVVQEQMGNADESIKSFQVALVHKSNHGPAMANLAVLMDAMGDGGASKMAQQALEHFPGHPVLIQISNSHTPTASESIVEAIPSETAVESTVEDSESHPFTPTAGLVIGANTSSVNDELDSIDDQLIEVND
ncbi:MAG: tetratricopeptide repeat protein, partial [Candidatus Thermoplasmatota archaeon]|nr:tetratricopeptide repeat protein [Candidatus Thermoplasmatota archaeon]